MALKGGTRAKFLDPNDAAIAKLLRGEKKDLDWVRAEAKRVGLEM